mmetsp:Transcript_22873/g.74649  ORF Transcript_22873/g.74649 Transcript_22873/m.74649 type:complete len:202 (+) Transcript_22873:158-763(+)
MQYSSLKIINNFPCSKDSQQNATSQNFFKMSQRLLQSSSKGLIDGIILKLKSRRLKLAGHGPLSSQQHFLSHLSKEEANSKVREGKDGWSLKSLPKSRREVSIGHGLRGAEIDRSREGGSVYHVADTLDAVPERDPREVLLPRAHDPSSSQVENGQELSESSSVVAENRSKPGNHHSARRLACSSFPSGAYFSSKKAGPHR